LLVASWAAASGAGLEVDAGAKGAAEARAVVDRVAVRFFAPETGGPAHPRFISERVLAFEARLDALTDVGPATGRTTVDDRRLRNALDRHVVEELLSALEEGSGNNPGEEARLAREVRADLAQRAGSDEAVWVAAEEEGLGADEVDEIVLRRARAAVYLDKAVARFLRPQEDQLREIFRTSQHPFRERAYDEVKPQLSRWFVFERLKTLESTFLQTARARVTIVVIPR
jgi:hypothetical protein